LQWPGYELCAASTSIAKSLGFRAGLGKACAGSGIVQLVCDFLAEGLLIWCIRIFKEQEQDLELDPCFQGKSVERADTACPVQ